MLRFVSCRVPDNPCSTFDELAGLLLGEVTQGSKHGGIESTEGAQLADAELAMRTIWLICLLVYALEHELMAAQPLKQILAHIRLVGLKDKFRPA